MPCWRARPRLRQQGKDIINLGIGQPDFKTPAHIVEAAIKALRDGHHGYTPATGLLATREAVVRRTLTTTGVEVSPENVMILPGGKPTMYAAIIMFGEPGAEILYPDPGFPIYRSMIEFTGATPIPVPIREENGFAFSAEETLALITPQTRLLILNSPANPTGGVTPRAEIEKLVKGLEAHPHVAILSDEIYDVMTYDGEEHCSLLHVSRNPRPADRAQRLVEDLGDDRLAHGLVDLAEFGTRAASSTTRCASSRSIAGPASTRRASLPASPRSTARRTRSTKMMRAFDRRRKVVVEGLNALPGVSCITPKGAFYAFPNVAKTGWKAKKLASALLEEAGVALIGGPDFGILGEGYIRLSYANSEENILRAIERIADFLKK